MTYKHPTGTRKRTQHPWSSGKCKLKQMRLLPPKTDQREKTDNTKCQWGCGAVEFPYIADGDVKRHNFSRKLFGSFLKRYIYPSPTTQPAHCPREMQIYVYKKPRIRMFIADFLTKQKTWNKPGNKLWHSHTVGYCGATKRKKMLELKNLMLKEARYKRNTCSTKDKIYGDRTQISGCLGQGAGIGWEGLSPRSILHADEKGLCTVRGMGEAGGRTARLSSVHFTVWKSHPKKHLSPGRWGKAHFLVLLSSHFSKF